MKQLLLATALIAVPVAAFTGVSLWLSPAPTVHAMLGDLAPYKTIVADTQALAATGDFAGAEMRITDLETMWDEAEPTLRPVDTNAWGAVDDAADAAFTALRAGTPDAGKVEAALVGLQSVLDDPLAGAGAAAAAPTLIDGISITDENGRPLPCEVMLKTLDAALAGVTPGAADQSLITDFQTRALERCNADDDRHADEFTAQALAVLAN